jgi:phosphatidylserine decarboxylase
MTTQGTVFAPVSGKVEKINNEGRKYILFKIGLLNEEGIYLPFTCEIKNLSFHSDFSSFRFSSPKDISDEKGTVLELSDKKKRSISMQFVRFVSGKLPELIVLPGDRGRRQVNIGYFPFGGYVKLLLPSESEIVVKEGDKVVATEAIVARFLDEE